MLLIALLGPTTFEVPGLPILIIDYDSSLVASLQCGFSIGLRMETHKAIAFRCSIFFVKDYVSFGHWPKLLENILKVALKGKTGNVRDE
jgi:hypothetical protein